MYILFSLFLLYKNAEEALPDMEKSQLFITYSHVHLRGNICKKSAGKLVQISGDMERLRDVTFLASVNRLQIPMWYSSTHLIPVTESHLLHGGLVKLVQIKAVDSFLSSEKQILIWNDKHEINPKLLETICTEKKKKNLCMPVSLNII